MTVSRTDNGVTVTEPGIVQHDPETTPELQTWDRFVRLKDDFNMPGGISVPDEHLRAYVDPRGGALPLVALAPGRHPETDSATRVGVLGAPNLDFWELRLRHDYVEQPKIIALEEGSLTFSSSTGEKMFSHVAKLPDSVALPPLKDGGAEWPPLHCNVVNLPGGLVELSLAISSELFESDFRMAPLQTIPGRYDIYEWKVITQRPLDTVMSWYGQKMLVLPPAGADGRVLITPLEQPGQLRQAFVSDLYRLEERVEVHNLPEIMGEVVQGLQQTNTILTNRLTLATSRHESDIDLIGEKLMDEAESRNWCSDYDEIVDKLNERLNQKLPTRSRDYRVEVTVSYTVTVPVNARSEEAAKEQVEEMSNSTIWSMANDELSDREDRRNKQAEYEIGDAEEVD